MFRFHEVNHSFCDRETKSILGKKLPYEHFKHEGCPSINKSHQRILAMGAVTPPAYRASSADNSRGGQENHKGLTRQRPLIQAEHIQKTPAIQSQPIQGPLALKSSFCRGTAKLLLLIFAETQRSTTQKRTVLSPQVTFLCNSSLETITLP